MIILTLKALIKRNLRQAASRRIENNYKRKNNAIVQTDWMQSPNAPLRWRDLDMLT